MLPSMSTLLLGLHQHSHRQRPPKSSRTRSLLLKSEGIVRIECNSEGTVCKHLIVRVLLEASRVSLGKRMSTTCSKLRLIYGNQHQWTPLTSSKMLKLWLRDRWRLSGLARVNALSAILASKRSRASQRSWQPLWHNMKNERPLSVETTLKSTIFIKLS